MIGFSQPANEAEEYATMEFSTEETRIVPLPQSKDLLTDILRQGAQQLLGQVIEAEVADWIERHAQERNARDQQQVVRNGHLPERTILSGVGPVKVRQPRVHDRRPEQHRQK